MRERDLACPSQIKSWDHETYEWWRTLCAQLGAFFGFVTASLIAAIALVWSAGFLPWVAVFSGALASLAFAAVPVLLIAEQRFTGTDDTSSRSGGGAWAFLTTIIALGCLGLAIGIFLLPSDQSDAARDSARYAARLRVLQKLDTSYRHTVPALSNAGNAAEQAKAANRLGRAFEAASSGLRMGRAAGKDRRSRKIAAQLTTVAAAYRKLGKTSTNPDGSQADLDAARKSVVAATKDLRNTLLKLESQNP
jgi:hypothetical protein